jgi:hypothetical protein
VNTLVPFFALLSALVLAGTAVSLFALHRAYHILREIDGKKQGIQAPESAADVQEMRDAIQSLGAQFHELQKNLQETVEPVPGVPGPSFNLSRRSQVLRMYRRGDAAGQIAASLGLPRQEVDLLIKVHRIVLSKV